MVGRDLKSLTDPLLTRLMSIFYFFFNKSIMPKFGGVNEIRASLDGLGRRLSW